MKHHGYNWISRRNELINDEVAAKEIQSIIQREFNIFLRLDDINAKIQRHISQIDEINDAPNELSSSDILEKVRGLLPEQGLKSREISKALMKKHGVTRSKRDVFRMLFNQKEFSYSPINFKWTTVKKNNDAGTPNVAELLRMFDQFVTKLRSQAESMFVESKSGFTILDNAVVHVVRDNFVSENELRFLKNLSLKVGFSGDLEELVNKNLHSHNPYLDSLIHGAFHDGIIEDFEIHTIAEQALSIGFDMSFLTQRFWCIALSDYFDDLARIPSFQMFLKLSFLENRSGDPLPSLNILLSHAQLTVESRFEESLGLLIDVVKKTAPSSFTLSEKEFMSFELKQTSKSDDNDSQSAKNHEESDGQQPLLRILKIMNEEREKLGDPIANLLVENILFQIDKES